MTLRLVVMGVSGCGKSSVGAALAQRLGARWRDADDLRPPASVARMRRGEPLTDADRAPWLDAVAGALAREAPVVVGCSALRRAYRNRLRAGAGGPLRVVHLCGDRALIARRLAARSGRFMPAALLDSQFAALEPPGPDEALSVSVDRPLEAIAAGIVAQVQDAAP